MVGVRLGLTGTIGSGKSTVLSLLENYGWRGVRTDCLAREEMARPEVLDLLRQRWGTHVFSEPDLLDRGAVARIVFRDENELRWLEEILHPRVRARWLEMVESGSGEDVVVEIPLLFEKNLASHFDFVVSLSCPEVLQSRRLIERGHSAEDIEARKLRQFSAGEKNSRADFVISNCGTLLFLEKQALGLSDRIREIASQKL